MGYELAQQLALRGHNVHLISDETEIPKSANLQVHSIPRTSFTESALRVILDLERTGKTELVHIQNLIIHRSLSGLVKSLKDKTRVPILSYCCQLPSMSAGHWMKILRKDPKEAFSSKIGMLAPTFLANAAVKNVDMIVTSSHYLEQRLVNKTMRSKDHSRVVYPFVSSVGVRTLERDQVSRNNSNPQLLYLGSHRVLRGEHDFLVMMARLKTDLPNVHATLVTPQPLPRRIERLVHKHQLSASLQYLSREVQLNFADLLRRCDAYVFTGLPPVGSIDPPLTIIEALILGTPVISYDAGGISEVLAEGQLVPYGKVSELTHRVKNLIDNNPHVKIPRPDLLEKYGSENAVRSFEKFYEELT
jgi:glycosyltransferase involved in cell wall biosynthesis